MLVVMTARVPGITNIPGGHLLDGLLGTDPEALADLDLDSLVGLSVAQARSRVEDVGGVLRAVAEGTALGLRYRPGLVTVITRDDKVVSVFSLQGRVQGSRPDTR